MQGLEDMQELRELELTGSGCLSTDGLDSNLKLQQNRALG